MTKREFELRVLRDRNEPLAEAIDSLFRSMSQQIETLFGAAIRDAAATSPWVPPTTVGEFRVLHELGSGGMGRVFLAQQEHPRRVVALKLLREGAISEEGRLRFEREARLLAGVAHPGIAQVYTAGVAQADERDQPYIAMEFVEGLVLDEFVREQRPDERALLRIVADVCAAVDAAHERGIVHRDLKPANIVVQPDGSPKVLDFGVAWCSDDPGLTRTGQLLGTPRYMAPERFSGDARVDDPRSDVYALGVLLYELLSGVHPHGFDDVPLGEAIRRVSANEARPLGGVCPLASRDVATIVHTSVAALPAGRYATAGALGRDIERHLSNQPIEARNPSRLESVQAFIRRNPSLAAGVVSTALALLIGLVGTLRFAWDAQRSKKDAETQSEVASGVKDYLVLNLLAASNPAASRVVDPTVSEVLENAVRRLHDADLAPDVECEIRLVVAESLLGLGRYDDAQTQLSVVDSMGWGGDRRLRRLQIRLEISLAKQRYDLQTEVRLQRSLSAVLEEMHEHDHVRVLVCRARRAYLDLVTGVDGAVGRASLELNLLLDESRHRTQSAGHLRLLRALKSLAWTLGQFDLAVELAERVAVACRQEQHPLVLASALCDLGAICQSVGRLADAVLALRESGAIRTEWLAQDHPLVAEVRYELAQILVKSGQHDEALEEAMAAHHAFVRSEGPVSTWAAKSGHLVGLVHVGLGDFDSARRAYEQSLVAFGDDTEQPVYRDLKFDLASLDLRTGRFTEALGQFVAIRRRGAAYGPQHPKRLAVVQSEARCLRELRRFDEAGDLLDDLLAQPLSARSRREVLLDRAFLHRARGSLELALEDESTCVELVRLEHDPGASERTEMLRRLSTLRLRAGQWSEATSLVESELSALHGAAGCDRRAEQALEDLSFHLQWLCQELLAAQREKRSPVKGAGFGASGEHEMPD